LFKREEVLLRLLREANDLVLAKEDICALLIVDLLYQFLVSPPEILLALWIIL